MTSFGKTIGASIATLLLLADVTIVAAQSPTPSGTIRLESTSITIGIGVNWGEGTLTFQDEDYPFEVSGLNVIDVGIAKLEAVGTVYNLTKPDDLGGTYMAGKMGAAFGSGVARLSLQNQNGVIIYLSATQQGLNLSLGPGGFSIVMKGRM